ncbi:VanZ family protein [Desulfocurvibacter africanus]|uniref:VanZ family protein n=1 Tax=Desulfocurvibacter africanus TaxID=873 RepID=UPI0003F72FD2|nr:VanZ family protein [Desulfocurvibacter africanus]
MRSSFRVAWLASLAATAWLSLQPQPEFPVEFWNADKVYHLLGYAWLGLLGILSFEFPASRRRALLFTLAFGITMEFLQGFVPGRMPSFWDGVANAAGVGLAWAAKRFNK